MLGMIAAGIAAGAASGAIGYATNREQAENNASLSWDQYKKQRELDYNYDTNGYFALDQRYNQADFDWAKAYDEKNYDLTRRYTENTASWTVEGLRRAGLNPILAAGSGFNANTGTEGTNYSANRSGRSGGSMPNIHGNGGVSPNFLGALQAASSIDVQSSTADKLKADTNVAQAQADQIKADTLKTYVDAINAGKNGGYSGWQGLINNGLSGLVGEDGFGDKRIADLFKKNGNFERVPSVVDSGIEKGAHFVNWLKNIIPSRAATPPNSAKDQQEKRVWLTDLSNAVDISKQISPSPVPLKPVPRNDTEKKVLRENPSLMFHLTPDDEYRKIRSRKK